MRARVAIALCLCLLLAGCVGKHIDPAQPGPQQRIATFNRIVMIANDGLAPTIQQLAAAEVIPADAAEQIAAYQAAVATATRGIDAALQEAGSWQTKALKIKNLALSLVPPDALQKLHITDAKWAALCAALQGVETTIQIIVEVSKQ